MPSAISRTVVAVAATALALSAALEMAGAQEKAAPPPKVDLRTWKAPDIATVADTPDGKLIKYGHALLTETHRYIGPEVTNPASRFAGNNFSCQTCHLHSGTQTYGMPYTGVWGTFPQYRARENEVSTLEERINGCMMRSMNGKPLPLDGREMKAMMAYMKWLSSGIPVGAELIGQGTKSIVEPNRASDPKRGAVVYAEMCASCHGESGLGVRRGAAGDAGGYEFPPLWGPDSYNTGAGMYRVLTAAAFIKHNMPHGTTFDATMLSDEDAYDVAAYINSQPRPEKPGLDQDFPNRLRKPVDAPFPPFVEGFTAEQHKYGPFEPIRLKLRELQKQARERAQQEAPRAGAK